MVRRGLVFFILFAIVLLAGIYSGFAQTPEPSLVNPSVAGGYALVKGKNLITPTHQTYPAQLMYFYPEIESISYYDEFLGAHLGYVNVFGGVGSNFIIRPGTQYEIVVREPIELFIP